MSSVLGFLPVVGLLACPVMMLVCVLGMRKMGGAGHADSDVAPAAAATPERVAALAARLDQLRLEQAAIAGELADLSAQSAQPTSPALEPASITS